jgi:hypothetical protein
MQFDENVCFAVCWGLMQICKAGGEREGSRMIWKKLVHKMFASFIIKHHPCLIKNIDKKFQKKD